MSSLQTSRDRWKPFALVKLSLLLPLRFPESSPSNLNGVKYTRLKTHGDVTAHTVPAKGEDARDGGQRTSGEMKALLGCPGAEDTKKPFLTSQHTPHGRQVATCLLYQCTCQLPHYCAEGWMVCPHRPTNCDLRVISARLGRSTQDELVLCFWWQWTFNIPTWTIFMCSASHQIGPCGALPSPNSLSFRFLPTFPALHKMSKYSWGGTASLLHFLSCHFLGDLRNIWGGRNVFQDYRSRIKSIHKWREPSRNLTQNWKWP